MQIQQTCLLSNGDITYITDALPADCTPERTNDVINRVAVLVQAAFILGQNHPKK